MSPEINQLLGIIDADKVLLDSAHPLSPAISKNLSEKLMVEWTYHSNAIERNSLTLIETEAVINGLTVAGKSFREVKEIENHRKAVEFVAELVKEKRDLTETEIREIHALILAEIRPNDAGRYRQFNVLLRNGTSNPPDHIYVANCMASLIEWYHQASGIHPIKRIAIFHARFEIIHPFIDGNGRTGRLLMNLELMKLGYPPGIIRTEYALDYHRAIQIASAMNDYSEMTAEIAWSVLDTLDMYLQVLNLRKEED